MFPFELFYSKKTKQIRSRKIPEHGIPVLIKFNLLNRAPWLIKITIYKALNKLAHASRVGKEKNQY